MKPVWGKILELLIYKMFEFLKKLNKYLRISQDSNQETPPSVSYYVSLTIFNNHSMMASRQEVDNQKHWIKFGTIVLSTS